MEFYKKLIGLNSQAFYYIGVEQDKKDIEEIKTKTDLSVYSENLYLLKSHF